MSPKESGEPINSARGVNDDAPLKSENIAYTEPNTARETTKAEVNDDLEPAAEKAKEPKQPRISFCKLFKYSSCNQKMLVIIGLISSCISGAAAPSIAIVFGEIVAIFNPTNTDEEVNDGIIELFKMIGVLCGILWVFGYLQYACLQAVAE